MNRRTLVFGAAAGALLGFGGAAFFTIGNNSKEPAPAISNNVSLIRPYSPTLGPYDAPVTIVEFFDPACEACRAFHPIVKKIMESHPGKIRLVMRYAAFHPPSAEAISLLEAARMQNLFEPVLEKLYETQPLWAPHGRSATNVWEVVKDTGLDVERARSQAKMPDIVAVLNQEATDIKTVGVQKTPTFFVNGKLLTEFGRQQLIDLVKSEMAASAE
ncbi:MAG: DsbA family protein [Alphaproteobacteria bacterium]|nr:DsbA family protein [Rhodospirillales bacterium]MCW9046242.1 DsbA family protein [Alphaproteobacteria bacterium]